MTQSIRDISSNSSSLLFKKEHEEKDKGLNLQNRSFSPSSEARSLNDRNLAPLIQSAPKYANPQALITALNPQNSDYIGKGGFTSFPYLVICHEVDDILKNPKELQALSKKFKSSELRNLADNLSSGINAFGEIDFVCEIYKAYLASRESGNSSAKICAILNDFEEKKENGELLPRLSFEQANFDGIVKLLENPDIAKGPYVFILHQRCMSIKNQPNMKPFARANILLSDNQKKQLVMTYATWVKSEYGNQTDQGKELFFNSLERDLENLTRTLQRRQIKPTPIVLSSSSSQAAKVSHSTTIRSQFQQPPRQPRIPFNRRSLMEALRNPEHKFSPVQFALVRAELQRILIQEEDNPVFKDMDYRFNQIRGDVMSNDRDQPISEDKKQSFYSVLSLWLHRQQDDNQEVQALLDTLN